MRKMTFIVSLFVSLMLTPLAIAQGWKSNEVTNRTTRNVYLVFSTWRPATQSLPEGYRITGHYRLMPNQTHEFYALNNNAFYLQVWHPDLKVIKPTATRETFTAPVITDPFEMVLRRQISFAFRTNTILYRQPSVDYPLEDGFLRYGNTGTPINITSTWVSIDVPTPLPHSPDEAGEPPPSEASELEPSDPSEIPPPGALPPLYVPPIDIDEPYEETTGPVIPPEQISLSALPSTVEPGQRATVTITARTTTGNLIPGAQISLSTAFGNIRPNLVQTNAQGQATSTWTAPPYTGTPHIDEIATNTITATADANVKVRETTRIVMKYTPGSLSVSDIPSSLTSGQAYPIVVTVKSESGTLLSKVRVTITTNAEISFGSLSGTTDSSGKWKTTLSAEGDGSFTVNAGGRSKSYTLKVKPRPESTVGSFRHTRIPSSIPSGEKRNFTFTPLSRNRTPMSGVRVTITETDDAEISFSSLSGITNSSGQWKTTMYTGGVGPADFTVKVGNLSKTYTLTVKPAIVYEERWNKFEAECRNRGWMERTVALKFPGRIISYEIDISGSDAIMFRDDFELHSHRKTSSNTVTVRFSVWEDDCRNRWRRRNWANVTVGAKCEVTAPLRLVNGAPSLHPQAYEQDLSLVAAHPRMQLPSENALLPNYPNPFNPETWIPYQLAKPADVTLTIYAVNGKVVWRLVLGHQLAGVYQSRSRAAYWDGRNALGEPVASGIYFYTLTAGDFSATKKMLIRK